MNGKTVSPNKDGSPKKDGSAKKAGTGRKDRLAEQLRANLQKRKAQSRSRRTGDADKRPEGLQAVMKKD
ncbi:hypothetical protein NKH33_16335 [Mesorhizobium sp. M1182]|uniref:hypothetical protein n=1 Tax=unclassified Mesorhizobium TaxID=325217 RepID=UPI0033391F3C